VFFREQTPEALREALVKLHDLKLNPHTIRAHAEQFDRKIFKENYRRYVERKVALLRSSNS
jgi:hypothetical protein